MGIFDRLIGRKKTEEKKASRRSFQAAMFNRLVHDWVAGQTSMDAEVRGAIGTLRNRSRDMVRNNPYAKNALRAITNNVIGQGIGLQAQVYMRRGRRLDKTTNDQIESAWQEWSKRDSCHVAGLLSFHDIERLVMTAVPESGEVFIRLVKQRMGKSRVPLALEVIEADLLDDGYNDTRAANGNEIRFGIERNQWGRPVAFHFLSKHPGDTHFTGNYRDRVRIPAEEIIHLYRMERPGQTRGVPWMTPAIMRLHHLQGFEEAEVIRARGEASLMGFITSPEGDALTDGNDGDDRVTAFEPGTIKQLLPGEDFKDFTPNRAGGQFDPFLRAMLRSVAAGVGVSYEALSKDYSQSNYSSSRLALLDDRDNWRVLQQWIITNLHERIFDAWLDLAILSGAINLPTYEANPQFYKQARWMARGWSWVDPQKEVTAYKEAVKAGFTTLTDVIAQSGGDVEDIMDRRAAELEMAEQLGLKFDTDVVAAAEPAQQPADETSQGDINAD
jgi:lambda family phage portal protein